ncbi:glycosyltransferase [Gammaproteobacteria bacterium 54_18_T64]|nr:glycosyltransferase [Gammaproteobacteria bacterium 54_18_T64]
MKDRKHLLVLDPTAFAGGSKVATATLLNTLDPDKIVVTVLSADPQSWRKTAYKCLHLYQPKCLSRREQGLPYFLRHSFIALFIILARLRCGKIDIALGASGPGVDLALFLVKPWLGFRLVQMVHGPVARSRTIARCLRVADQVNYLESSKGSLLAALSIDRGARQEHLGQQFSLLPNALDPSCWPTPCQRETPVVFWAASLLQWKGLDILLAALQYMAPTQRPPSHICYIQPVDCALPVSRAPISISGVHWHENPHQLDALRSSANIFVSTSTREPFGLSILEAMAAGHCVLIPADGAHWDRTLSDNINCIKYRAANAQDLSAKLLALSHDMAQVVRLGRAAAKMALDYRADKRFAALKNSLEMLPATATQATTSESSEWPR